MLHLKDTLVVKPGKINNCNALNKITLYYKTDIKSIDWICYGLLDDITDTFAPLIRGIEFEVDSIDELVLILKESEQSDMLRRIGYCRKKMMSLLRLLVAKSDVVKTLIKRGEEQTTKNDIIKKNRPTIDKDVIIYLGDIQGNTRTKHICFQCT